MEEVDIGNFDTLESRARLQSSERYMTIMEVGHSPRTPKSLSFRLCKTHRPICRLGLPWHS